MHILLTIAYDGTNYAGWQRQDNAIAVQEKLENALSVLLSRQITVRSASRTDAGVHALGQRASFFAPDLRIPVDKLPIVLVGMLPPDISVTAAEVVSDEFNPRFDAKCKTYAYNLYHGACPNPLLRRYSVFIPQKLNIDNMKKAAKSFVGRHDFAAFCATGSSAKTTIREIYDCKMDENPDFCYTLTITGNGFLYNMVRIIAGTILYVGTGKILPGSIPQIISSCERKQAGKTMPPEGLTLMSVEYGNYTQNFC